MITTTHRVVRFSRRRTFESRQVLQRENRIFGICVWRTDIDQEDVPVWAGIQIGCLGDTEWQSRLFKQHADKITQ